MRKPQSDKKAKKQATLGENAFVVAWRMAVNEYMATRPCTPAEGGRVPKRGTDVHERLKTRQQELIPAARQRIRERKMRAGKPRRTDNNRTRKGDSTHGQRAVFLCDRPAGGWPPKP
jgi:hypothetical protein